MGNEKYAKHPILYIIQPSSEEVQARMQYHYRSSKMDEEKVDERTRTMNHQSIYKDVSEELEQDERNERADREKNFREMTVEEQLVYLTGRPDYAPQVICEVKTEGRIHQGIIFSYEEGIVAIRTGHRRIELEKEKIEHIRILGL